ncbi:hypothetical protein [Undibacterium crateris]|uniref:hypothetical protein n=1 Tax=Undibacterium crateris TaxID=2528175 RepID=UPI001389589F|nr:hypothetical protein [Undibacterium crateris]NDI85224.1 hypothetical protein [Undibacterium crateris]
MTICVSRGTLNTAMYLAAASGSEQIQRYQQDLKKSLLKNRRAGTGKADKPGWLKKHMPFRQTKSLQQKTLHVKHEIHVLAAAKLHTTSPGKKKPPTSRSAAFDENAVFCRNERRSRYPA